MEHTHRTTAHVKGKYLRWEDRLKLEALLKVRPKLSRQQLADALNCSRSTLQRELKRGKTTHQTTYLEVIDVYSPDLAQQRTEEAYSAKGPEYKLGADYVLVQAISEKIRVDRYSPDAVVMHFDQYGWPTDTRICTKTLYTYIDEGLIPEVGSTDLLYQGKRRKPRRHGPRRHKRAISAGRSISDRPEAVNQRLEMGHWEIDTVVGGTDTSPDVLLVLTERVSRFELIRKIAARDQVSVIGALNKLERQYGSKTFRKLFRSITADNGGEFLDPDAIEQSCLTKGLRTSIYYAHPYSACERGSNEQANGMIRRYIPKGADISEYSKRYIKGIQDWMNRYPRRILNGKSAETLFQEFLAA